MNIKALTASLLLACFALFGCEADHPTDSTSSASHAETNQSKYFRQSNWPPADSSKPVELTANLVAKNYYLVIDGSTSMTSSQCGDGNQRIVVAKKAAKEFSNSLPPDTNVGMLAFDEAGISERVPLGPLNKNLFGKAVDALVANTNTPLYTSIKIAYEKLETQARTQLGAGEYHLVIITDGDPSPSSEDPTRIIDQILAESPVMVHTIGFCIGEHHTLNRPGQTLYVSATDPASLRKGLQEVFAELPTFVAVQ